MNTLSSWCMRVKRSLLQFMIKRVGFLASENGNRHSECMLPFTARLIPTDPLKYGSIFILSILLLAVMPGRMSHTMILHFMFYMMGHNPKRSWAKTYNQLWNLSMCTPVQKHNHNNTGSNSFQGNSHGGNGNKFNQSQKGRNGGRKSNRPCWKFNKNQPCTGPCDFDHQCSYCGAYGHSVLDCDKLFSKKNEARSGGSGNNNNARGK